MPSIISLFLQSLKKLSIILRAFKFHTQSSTRFLWFTPSQVLVCVPLYRLDMLKTKAAERRDTIMSGITVAATTLGAGLADFLDDSERRSAFVVAVSTAVLGIYTAKVSSTTILCVRNVVDFVLLFEDWLSSFDFRGCVLGEDSYRHANFFLFCGAFFFCSCAVLS